MKNLISKQFVFDEELDGIVGGDSSDNNKADPNEMAYIHANPEAAFLDEGGTIALSQRCTGVGTVKIVRR